MGSLTSGDGARFVALDRVKFEASFAQLPASVDCAVWNAWVGTCGDGDPVEAGLVPLDDEHVDVVVEACVTACLLEKWRGKSCYGDLTRVLSELKLPDASAAVREAWSALGTILSSPPDAPHWLRARFHGNCSYACMPPARVASLSSALASTGATTVASLVLAAAGDAQPKYLAPDLPSLAAFLERAAARDAWVIGAEWR